ncbi:MAG: hypothetical protein V4623_05265 [Pseudomonadota bacterium]
MLTKAEVPVAAPVSLLRRLLNAQKRYTRDFVAEVVQVKGLMPLLMKRRNGGKWSVEEKQELLSQLRLLWHLSPVLLFLLLPGSALLLPFYAWWLERRRQGRARARSLLDKAAALEESVCASDTGKVPPNVE